MFTVSRLFVPSPEKVEQRKQDIIEREQRHCKEFTISRKKKGCNHKNIS